MAKKIHMVSCETQKPVPKMISPVPVEKEPDEEAMTDDEEIDYAEVHKRSEEIDDLTREYIASLMCGDNDDSIALVMEILDESDIEDIENEIERILADRGIFIYRPTIIEDINGKERVVSSVYEDDDFR